MWNIFLKLLSVFMDVRKEVQERASKAMFKIQWRFSHGLEILTEHAISSGDHLIGNDFIVQPYNGPKHTDNAVKAYLERKTHSGSLSVVDWFPQSFFTVLYLKKRFLSWYRNQLIKILPHSATFYFSFNSFLIFPFPHHALWVFVTSVPGLRCVFEGYRVEGRKTKTTQSHVSEMYPR